MKNLKFWIIAVVAAIVITAIVEAFNKPHAATVEKFNPIVEHSEIVDTI